VVTLHKSTVAFNFASTSNNDIYGTVTYQLTVIADRWFFPAPIARPHKMAMTEKPSSP